MFGTLPGMSRLAELTSVLDRVDYSFRQSGHLVILYIHLPTTEIIEERFGFEALSAVQGIATQRLQQVARDWRREWDVHVARGLADDMVVFVADAVDGPELARKLSDELAVSLRRVDEELADLARVHIGYTRVRHIEKMRPGRLVEHGIRQALLDAVDAEQHALRARLEVLEAAIRDRAFRMVYQPIVEARTGAVFAYEALVRSTVSELASPLVLFDTAERTNTVWQVSRVCRELGVAPLGDLPVPQMLFLNLHPSDFSDPDLLKLEDFMRPWTERVVFEVTERAAISDYEGFRQNVRKLTDFGFRIAVDDLGSGYASLNSVAQLDPDFIKIDMGLVRNIRVGSPQERVVKTIVDFAEGSGSKIIAEGIENVEELGVLQELGCHYMQGYYFARPEPPFVVPDLIG